MDYKIEIVRFPLFNYGFPINLYVKGMYDTEYDWALIGRYHTKQDARNEINRRRKLDGSHGFTINER